MSSLRDRTVSGLSWNGAGQAVRQAFQLIVSIVLARLLTPEDFGLMGMIVVFTGFANLFCDLGLGAALIQKPDLKQAHLSSAFWLNVSAGIVLTAVVAGLSPLIAFFYGKPILRGLTIAISLNFAVGSFKVVHNAVLQKNMSFRRLAQIEIVAVCFAGGVAVCGALMGLGVWSLVVQSLAVTVASVGMTWWVSPWRPGMSFNLRAIRELLGFSSNLLGSNIVNYWLRNLDNVLIGKFIGSAPLGIYCRAYSLMLLPVSQTSRVVSRVMFPALSSIRHDVVRVKRVYLRSVRSIALVTFPMMMGLIVVAEPFVLFIYGEKWRDVVPVLKIFCLTGMGQSVGMTLGWIFTSQGRTDLMFKWVILAGLVTGSAFVIGLRWGIMGVAVAYMLSGYIILWYPSWTIPGRLINLGFGEMLKNLSGLFCCAFVMGGSVWALGLVLPLGWPPWAYLSVQCPFGLLVYIGLLQFFGIKAYMELCEFVKEEWKRRRWIMAGQG